MPTPKYPLKPLLEHRERKVDDATAELGQAVRARESAEDAKRRAEEERKAAEAKAQAIRESEAQKLANGELSVADLARADAWSIAAHNEKQRLDGLVKNADGKVADARSAEATKRGDLAKSKADHDVVAKDEERFVDRSKKKALAAEEEGAEEAYRGRRT
jgi:murein hydrolase activator